MVGGDLIGSKLIPVEYIIWWKMGEKSWGFNEVQGKRKAIRNSRKNENWAKEEMYTWYALNNMYMAINHINTIYRQSKKLMVRKQ